MSKLEAAIVLALSLAAAVAVARAALLAPDNWHFTALPEGKRIGCV